MAAEGVIPHIVLEKEFDRVLTAIFCKILTTYHPACGIMLEDGICQSDPQAIPLVKP